MARFYRGKRVSPEWQSVLLAAEIQRGRTLDLNSGRRTIAEQTRLWRAYQAFLNGGPWAPLAAFPNPTAPHIRVGRPDHALDIDTGRGDAAWFDDWCTDRGMPLAHTVSGEPWHVECLNPATLKGFAKKWGVSGRRQQPEELRLSDRGLTMIASFEGFRAKAYKPVETERHWTIGFGHYGPDVREGQVITRERGLELLRTDATEAANAVRDAVNVPITQNEFDALVSLTFNIGTGGFRSSTLLRLLNQNKHASAGRQFLRWNKAGGRVLLGLSRRRRAERKLFRSK